MGRSRVWIDPDNLIIPDHVIGRWLQRVWNRIHKGVVTPEQERQLARAAMIALLKDGNPNTVLWKNDSWWWQHNGIVFIFDKDRTKIKTVFKLQRSIFDGQ